MKIAIVGAGIHGLSTARELSKRGHQVTVFEQHRPGNPFGSSFGRTRIVRQAYPDQFYTEILLEGHALWYDLEAESGEKLIHEVGLLFVAPQDNEEMRHELDALDNLKLPHRILTPGEIREVHSHMVLGSDEIAVMTLSAGWADVPAVLDATRQIAESHGASFVQERVVDLVGLGTRFDRVVLTAGAWITKFIDLPLATTLQTFGYIDQEMHGPVWIEGFGDHMYGFPSEPGAQNAKIGFHTAGPATDPDDPDRNPQPDALAAVCEAARRRFGLAVPSVVESGCCLYTTAANEDFKVFWCDERILAASPCSGHGFKFGPWMGRFLADILEGKESLGDWPRFGF
ncbi:MAG: FAD-dependent oxidoreductase [Armatimonadetes bacterium]|nr:FAD-dependent oxidoreductase [Armatimonadota bacterium]